jgi:hypothetical protein
MRVLFAGDALPKSIFLAGPTPRSAHVPSWRPRAIELLESMLFDGDVLAPERSDWVSMGSYDEQVYWEWEGLNLCTQVVFWVPREIADMPAFTTNIEFGMAASSGKSVLGFPPEAPKMRYLAALAQRHGVPVAHTLEQALSLAVQRCRAPFGSW